MSQQQTASEAGTPPKLAQKIDFALGYPQIIRMLLSGASTGLRFTIGITELGEIIVESSGLKIDTDGNITITSDSERPCPIPPGCPTIEACRQKALETMPPEFNTNSLNLMEVFQNFTDR